MADWILHHQTPLRLGAFFAILLVALGWESVAPSLVRRESRLVRWPANLGILVLGSASLRLLVPMGAMAAAFRAEEGKVGLLHQVALPDPVALLLAIVLLDLAIYCQHLVFHKVPILWRLHRVHHADRDFDVTTALRFHPIEILLSLGIKVAVVYVLGAPPAAVLCFEILLNGAAMFNHSNASLPPRLDSLLRLVLVTPDMHRVHHSARRKETNSNYGFNLPWWDRLFRTYRPRSEDGDDIVIGLPEYQQVPKQPLWWLLVLPFRKD